MQEEKGKTIACILFIDFASKLVSAVCHYFSHWLCLREEKIIAKGKGELVTYWLQVKASTNGPKSSCSSASGDDTSNNSATETENICQNPLKQHSRKSKKLFMDKFDRLIDWNADNLLRFLQQISDFRQSNVFESKAKDNVSSVENFCKANPFDEVKEIIALPQVKKSKIVAADALIPVSVIVIKQLRDYVARIAYMYNDNHFHSFDHVSLSVLFDICFICCTLKHFKW